MNPGIIDIHSTLENIGDAVMKALSYESYPVDSLADVIEKIDLIIATPEHLNDVEKHFKSSGSNYVLFYISNIIYNLRVKEDLTLSADNLKWLGSVWKNFLKRNRSYQELFPLMDEYRRKFDAYYPGGGSFVNQISNVHLVKNDYIDKNDDDAALRNLERFHQIASELLTWMKPTYYFLIDYYYERRMVTGEDRIEATILERDGLQGFGQKNYTYLDVLVIICQSLGVLEAIYLILKKKRTSRQIVNVDGKQKFLTVSEIYHYYLDRFNLTKKELTSLLK
jgi:hypothetical protein